MGTAMGKEGVIFGGNHAQKLVGFSAWTAAKKAVADQVGPGQTCMWSAAESAVAKWKGEAVMADAYLKIGVVGHDLILRAKAKKFLGDDQRDVMLLKGYTLAAAEWKKRQQEQTSGHKTGREIIAEELGTIKSREQGYKILKSLGVNDSQLGMLTSDSAVKKLLTALKVDEHDIAKLVQGQLLINVKQQILDGLDATNDSKLLVKLALRLGLPAASINALAGGYSPEHLAKELVALGVKAGRAKQVSEILVDAETPEEKTNRKLSQSKDFEEVVKRLVKLGIPERTVRDWHDQSSLEDIQEALEAKGVARHVAKALAERIAP